MLSIGSYNELAEQLGVTPMYRGAVISVHGMNTRGAWQKEIAPTLQDASLRHVMVDYGTIWLGAAAPGMPSRIAEQILSAYDGHKAAGCGQISAIGHSLGTPGLAAFLTEYPDEKLHRIVLRAAVLRANFDWTRRLIEFKQAAAVLNEACPNDMIQLVASFAPWGGGRSGRNGFVDLAGGRVHNRYYREAGHTGLLTRSHCKGTWIPFLVHGEVSTNALTP